MATYQPVAKASFSTSSMFNPLPLLSDGDDIVTRSGTVASGIGVLKRGTILNTVPSTGVTTVGALATDANCILMEDVDATLATQACLLLMAGKVKADALIWPGALNHGAVADNLRNFGILVESVVFTDGTLVKSLSATEADAQVAQAKLDAARGLERTKTPDPLVASSAKPGDSAWAYMTAEEKQNEPELATEAMAIRPSGEEMPDVPSVTIDPTSDTALASGGSGSIAVTITSPGLSGTWTVDKDSTATWLSYTPTTPQTEDGAVSWTAAANTTGLPQVAHLYINGKTFTLNLGAV